jgi:hypothetical protein
MRLLPVEPVLARWNDRTHFYSVWPIPCVRTRVLLFELCFAQFLFGMYFSNGEFALCFGPIEITIIKRGDWCEALRPYSPTLQRRNPPGRS